MSAQPLPRVLCVDDEPRVVEGLALNLRGQYEVHTALGGEEALRKLHEVTGVAVIVSDMRMPGMDGASLLQRVRQSHPQTTRILLTGDPGRDSAMLAVNKGQIFRYLKKPCALADLQAALEAGVSQYRLMNAEKTVLLETLLGLIAALIDTLSIINPVAFGRSRRVAQLAMDFARSLGYSDFWQLEAAAMLSQIGFISLPVELSEKVYYDQTLTPQEKAQAGAVEKVATQLLDHVPRLEPVTQVLAALAYSDEQVAKLGEGMVGMAARILGMTLEFDSLVLRGSSPDVAIQSVQARTARFGADLLARFAQHVGARSTAGEVREMPIRSVMPGMTILRDVRTRMGTLLVPRGFEVTARFLEKIHNFGPEVLDEKVPVRVTSAALSKEPG